MVRMGISKRYRDQAEDLERMAKKAGPDGYAAELRKLAAAWRELAQEAVQLEQRAHAHED